ncbi:MAG: hypothetical protein R2792_00345 [Saprospiraceae bacterium]
MAQKYRLRDFEFSINPGTWNIAQDLVQHAAVKSLKELEKNYWVAMVQDGISSYEVEVIISPQKINAFSCECWSEQRQLMCAHVAAGLLTLRQFLQKRAEQKVIQKAKQEKSNDSGRLTVQHVLSSIPAEKLSDFIQEYARRDRDFALAFKTWFAGEIQSSKNPFELVLESAISKNINRQTDFRRLRRTLDDLAAQMDTALEAHFYTPAFQIASAIIHILSPLAGKIQAEQNLEQVLHFENKAFDAIDHLLLSNKLAPELREASSNFLFSLIEFKKLPELLYNRLAASLAPFMESDSYFEQVKQLWEEENQVPEALAQQILLTAYARRGNPDACARILCNSASNTNSILDQLQFLSSLGYHEAVVRSAEAVLDSMKLSPLQTRQTDALLLESSQRLSEPEHLRSLFERRYIATGNALYLEALKSHAGNRWPLQLEELLRQLILENQTDRIASLLASEKNYNSLQAVLHTAGNLDLLEQYAAELEDAFIIEEYKLQLSQHLKDHFGKPASAFCYDKLLRLANQGKQQAATSIANQLIANFPDRPSLSEEFEEILAGRSTKKLSF